MKLTFLGANHEVTGSCTLLEAAGQRYLIDCGMEQGKDIYENQPIPVAPGEIDGVLATHAHIDHTGLLPLLVRNGFRGKIYATKPTTELCDIMLRDSAHIQEFEAEWKNRKAKRAGDAPVEPMYTVQDAEAAMKLFIGVDYETKVELAPGLEIRFVDVGHLLGSSSIEIWVTENGSTTKLVFSGDIGILTVPNDQFHRIKILFNSICCYPGRHPDPTVLNCQHSRAIDSHGFIKPFQYDIQV